jgi:hypothetical protein
MALPNLIHFVKSRYFVRVSSTHANGGNISLKFKIVLAFKTLKRVAMAAALLTNHEVKFTLLSVYSIGAFFHSYNNCLTLILEAI